MKVGYWFLVLLFFLPSVAAAQSLRRDTLRITVDFRRGYSTIDLGYCDNNKRLQELSQAIAAIHSDSTLRVEHVHVRGAASPDGFNNRNQALSEKRARNIADYLVQHTSLPENLFSVEAVGVDWAALEAMVDTSSMPYREEVLEVLRTVPEWIFEGSRIVDGRKRRLGMLRGGRPYQYMSDHFFPAMRRGHFITEVCITELGATHASADTTAPAEKPAESDAYATHNTTTTTTTTTSIPTSADTDANDSRLRIAVKTNMLYDAAAVPNLGVELGIGKRWSVAANAMLAWWSNKKRHRCYQLQGGDVEARFWLPSSRREALTGHHFGAYAQIADYDFEFGGKGRQSDGVSFGAGLSYGYSLAVGRHLNIDFTIGLGWFGGTYHKYLPVDDCFVWQSTVRQHWFGPTKAEISLVYVFGKKGGRR